MRLASFRANREPTDLDQSLKSELERRWRLILKDYCKFWMSGKLQVKDRDWFSIEQRVKRLEDFLARWVQENDDYEAAYILKDVIVESYDNDLLQEIFDSHWQRSCVENDSRSELSPELKDRYPSAKFFCTEIIETFFSTELQIIVDDDW